MNNSTGASLPPPLSTSSGLLEQVRARDADGWTRLAQLYGPLVYQWARRSRLQTSDAADVVQDVFATVWSRIEQFRKDSPGDTFRGWLWTITRNKVRDHFRRQSGRAEAAGGSDARRRLEELADCPPGENAAEGREPASGLVHRAVQLVRGEFEDRTWRAFWQTAVEGRRPADVASDLGMSVGAVYMAKSRILRRLRDVLDAPGR